MNLDHAEHLLSLGQADCLYQELANLYPADPDLDQLPDLIRFALGQSAAMPRLSGNAAIFAASINSAKIFWLGADSDKRRPHRINRRTIGIEFDFLGEGREPADWGAAMALNFLVMSQIEPTKRAAVVGTMRDDGIYTLEWIAHYLLLGFNSIFIYTNDNVDGSERLMRKLAEHGVITLIESETEGTVRPEVKAFEYSVHLLHDLRDHDWVLFVDSDEFFQPGEMYDRAVGSVLDDLVKRFPVSPPSAIVYEWLWYNSGMVFERRPGLLAERFQYASPHWLTKPLVRVRDIVSMRRQHIPDLRPDRRMVNSAFDPVDPAALWERRDPVYAGGRINHYWPKSFEEFSLKKARGDALRLQDDDYRRDFRLFFDWNGPETPDTHYPVHPAYLADARRKIAELRALDGVAECEQVVQQNFRTLMRRFDADGGLTAIYRRLNTEPDRFGVPATP